MSYELPANTKLNILLKVLIRLLLPYLLDPKSHLLRRPLDQIEKGLDVQIAHNLHIQNLIEHLNAFDFYVGAAVQLAVLLVRHQHAQKLHL